MYIIRDVFKRNRIIYFNKTGERLVQSQSSDEASEVQDGNGTI